MFYNYPSNAARFSVLILLPFHTCSEPQKVPFLVFAQPCQLVISLHNPKSRSHYPAWGLYRNQKTTLHPQTLFYSCNYPLPRARHLLFAFLRRLTPYLRNFQNFLKVGEELNVECLAVAAAVCGSLIPYQTRYRNPLQTPRYFLHALSNLLQRTDVRLLGCA